MNVKEGHLAAKNSSCIPDRQNIKANVHEAATAGEGESAILIDVQYTLLTILSTGTPVTSGLLGVALNRDSTIFRFFIRLKTKTFKNNTELILMLAGVKQGTCAS